MFTPACSRHPLAPSPAPHSSAGPYPAGRRTNRRPARSLRPNEQRPHHTHPRQQARRGTMARGRTAITENRTTYTHCMVARSRTLDICRGMRVLSRTHAHVYVVRRAPRRRVQPKAPHRGLALSPPLPASPRLACLALPLSPHRQCCLYGFPPSPASPLLAFMVRPPLPASPLLAYMAMPPSARIAAFGSYGSPP